MALRLHKLAHELGMNASELQSLCTQFGIQGKDSPFSPLEVEEIDQIKRQILINSAPESVSASSTTETETEMLSAEATATSDLVEESITNAEEPTYFINPKTEPAKKESVIEKISGLLLLAVWGALLYVGYSVIVFVWSFAVWLYNDGGKMIFDKGRTIINDVSGQTAEEERRRRRMKEIEEEKMRLLESLYPRHNGNGSNTNPRDEHFLREKHRERMEDFRRYGGP